MSDNEAVQLVFNKDIPHILYKDGTVTVHRDIEQGWVPYGKQPEEPVYVTDCTVCGNPIYEEQDYEIASDGSFTRHTYEEDCDTTEKTIGACVAPEKKGEE